MLKEGPRMPIKYDELMALKNFGQKYAYTDREVMLYAYGIGMGADPMDEQELAFVNEAVSHKVSLLCTDEWSGYKRLAEQDSRSSSA